MLSINICILCMEGIFVITIHCFFAYSELPMSDDVSRKLPEAVNFVSVSQ